MDRAPRVKELIDEATFRRVLGHYPTGVCVVTAVDKNGHATALVVGSFASVSLDPPLVAFFPDRRSSSWSRIEHVRKFCVNVLGSHQQDLCKRFSTKCENKFTGLDYTLSQNGSPILNDVIAWIDCSLEAVHEAGDHFIALGRVEDYAVVTAEKPLLFFRGQYGDFSLLPEAALS